MNARIKKLFTDGIQLWSFLLSIFFLLVAIVLVGFFYKQLPPFLPLYNKMAWGYERLGHTWEVIVPFGVALLFFFSNFFIAAYSETKVPLLARFLGLTTIAITFFTCVFLVKVVFVVL